MEEKENKTETEIRDEMLSNQEIYEDFSELYYMSQADNYDLYI